jgi:hypothetical protein
MADLRAIRSGTMSLVDAIGLDGSDPEAVIIK